MDTPTPDVTQKDQPEKQQTKESPPASTVKNTKVYFWATILFIVAASNIPRITSFYKNHFLTYTAEDDEKCRADFKRLQSMTETAVPLTEAPSQKQQTASTKLEIYTEK